MSKIFVGDPHVQVSNLKECEKLIKYIAEVALAENATEIFFSGDLGHTHAILNVKVQKFWENSFKELLKNKNLTIKAIVGNHDIPGDKETERDLSGLDLLGYLDSRVMIIKDSHLEGRYGYLAYHSNNEEFLSKSRKLYDGGAEFLFCHQTIQGSKYDNGMYAPDGVELDRIAPFKQIISGHIHSRQMFSNVFYPGTPKWDTASDANQEKGIWLIKEEGTGLSFKFFSTEKVVTPIKKYVVFETQDLPELDPNAVNIVELIGSSTWIGSTAKKLKGKCRLSTKPTDSMTRREQFKVSYNIEEFMESYKVPEGVTKEDLLDYVKQL